MGDRVFYGTMGDGGAGKPVEVKKEGENGTESRVAREGNGSRGRFK